MVKAGCEGAARRQAVRNRCAPKGKAYTGRIVLAGYPSAVVKVTLIWGKAAADRQTVTIHTLGAAYRKFPLHFTAGS